MRESENIVMQSQGSVLVVVGDRTANEVRESAEAMGTFGRVLQYYYDTATLQDFARSFLGESPCYNIGIAEPGLKFEIASALDALGWQAAVVVDPSARIAPSANVGGGSFVGPGAVISSNAVVGKHCIIHIHCSIGHDASVADYSAVLPGARISGRVAIGNSSIVGSNAFVGAGVSVGEDCRVDALAYVGSDLPAKHIASPRLESPIRRVV